MKIVGDLQSLHEELLSFGAGESFSLTYLTDGMTPNGLIAVKEAVRLCDVAVVVNTGLPLKEQHRLFLRRSAVDILFEMDDVQAGELAISLPYNKLPLEKMMRALLTVMPLVVTVHSGDMELLKVLQSIHNCYPYLFELSYTQTPVELMSRSHKALHHGLVLVRESIAQGEFRKDVLRHVLALSLQDSNGVVKSFEFIAKESDMAFLESAEGAAYVVASAMFGQGLVSDVLVI